MTSLSSEAELELLRELAVKAARVANDPRTPGSRMALMAAILRWQEARGEGSRPIVDPRDILFFGVAPGDSAGHHLYETAGAERMRWFRGKERLPEVLRESRLDGCYAPYQHTRHGGDPFAAIQTQGHARLTHVAGWTVIAWWDRTGDSRGGCNSALLIPALVGWEQGLELGRAACPALFQRLARAGVTLTLVESSMIQPAPEVES